MGRDTDSDEDCRDGDTDRVLDKEQERVRESIALRLTAYLAEIRGCGM